MVNQRDYSEELVEAAYRVLLELVRILGEYQEDIAVIGGWVPQLLLPEVEEPHIGSIDVDLAVNHQNVSEAGYQTILKALQSNGYRQSDEQPFIFYRSIEVDSESIEVEVDFLAGEYGGTGRGHRTQKAQDMRFRKARGADLVFRMPEKIKISGDLPRGGKDSAEILVASIPTLIVMKSFAMRDRLKEKDPWDIYYCLKNYPGGIDAISEEFKKLGVRGLVSEAIKILSEKFGSIDAVGPVHVADFEDVIAEEERAFLQRDSYERVQTLISQVFS
jgi:hypothetical protein